MENPACMPPETLLDAPGARLVDLVAEALATPDLAAELDRDPDRRARLLDGARVLAARAFEDEDPAALDAAHRALYHLASQSAWSPGAPPATTSTTSRSSRSA
jgi:hypothetical protein